MEEIAIIILCLTSAFAIMVHIGHFCRTNDLSAKELFAERMEAKNIEAEAKVVAHWDEYIDAKTRMAKYKKDLDTANEVIRHQAIENDGLRAVIRELRKEECNA